MKTRLIIIALVLGGVFSNGFSFAAHPVNLAVSASGPLAGTATPAPCSPDFHGVPADQFQACFDYWTQQGRYPVTLSAYQIGSAIYFAGSFQRVAPRYVRTLMNAQQLQQYFNEYQAQGYRPEQKSVLTTASGPLFTVIWVKDSAPFESRSGMTQAAYQEKFNQMHAAGWVNIDITPYRDGATLKYSGVWVKRPYTDYAAYAEMTAADYQAKFDQFFKQGFRVMRFVEYQRQNETRFAAIWEKIPGAYYHYYRMTPGDYQSKYNQLSAQGFRLFHLSALDNRISAIWIK